MADRLPSFLKLDQYDIHPEDVVRAYFNCAPTDIHEKAVVTPTWGAGAFEKHVDSTTTVFEGPMTGVWEVHCGGERISVIRSGMSAAFTGDMVIALACTPCETLLLSGSAGGLIASMRIGDLLIAEQSVCGDGFSRYLEPEIRPRDCFLDTADPDATLTDRLKQVAQRVAEERSVPLHEGKVFSTDSILGQFFRADHFAQNLGCIGIEMETAATFKAAGLVGIRASALLQISDVIPARKSLFSGRTADEMEERRQIKETVLPRILLETLVG